MGENIIKQKVHSANINSQVNKYMWSTYVFTMFQELATSRHKLRDALKYVMNLKISKAIHVQKRNSRFIQWLGRASHKLL